MLGLELVVFLTVSYTVGRERPNVAHLGSVPSTGSFPSGHIAATITLYGTIALLVHLVTRNRWARVTAWVWTVTAASMVGWARVYRGMHHPLDVARRRSSRRRNLRHRVACIWSRHNRPEHWK